jgi:hypothetical protein
MTWETGKIHEKSIIWTIKVIERKLYEEGVPKSICVMWKGGYVPKLAIPFGLGFEVITFNRIVVTVILKIGLVMKWCNENAYKDTTTSSPK